MLTNIQLLSFSEENLEWFNDNFNEIQEKYTNRIVAIKDKMIVASASNINSLLDILKEKDIDSSEVLIETITPKNEIVWELINPFAAYTTGPWPYNSLFKARRYSEEEINWPEKLEHSLPKLSLVCDDVRRLIN